MLNLRLKLWKVLGSPVVHGSVKKNSLLVNVLKFFGILAGWYGSAVVRERDRDTKAPGSRSGFDPAALRFSFFFEETLSITGQKFSTCHKNGSYRLRKGQLRYRAVSEYKVSTLYSGTKVDTGSLRANRFQFVSSVAVHVFVLGAKLMFKNGGCQGEME